MHIKFLKHGTGAGAGAAKYVLVDSNSLTKEILDGNPDQFSAVADSCGFVHRYSSAVISWSLEDAPTSEQIREALNGFYDVAFAGLDRDRFSPLAVLHTGEDGRKDMHILIPRVDLETGLSFNPAPPGWQKRYDPLRDMLNYKHDWTRPDDPLRKRIVNTKAPEKIDRKNGKEQINAWLMQRIEAGLIKSRQDVLNSLREIGEINRQGKDYVSIKLPDFDKPLRLKGVIYEQQFDAIAEREVKTEISRRCGVNEQEQRRRFESAQREFNEAIENTSRFNKKKYARDVERAIERTQEPEQAINYPTLAPDLYHERINSSDVIGDLGNNQISDRQNFNLQQDDRSERESASETKSSLSKNIRENTCGIITNDADRTAVDAIFAAVDRFTKRAGEIAHKAAEWINEQITRRAESARDLSAASIQLEQSSADFGHSVGSLGAAIDRFDGESYEQKITQLLSPTLAHTMQPGGWGR